MKPPENTTRTTSEPEGSDVYLCVLSLILIGVLAYGLSVFTPPSMRFEFHLIVLSLTLFLAWPAVVMFTYKSIRPLWTSFVFTGGVSLWVAVGIADLTSAFDRLRFSNPDMDPDVTATAEWALGDGRGHTSDGMDVLAVDGDTLMIGDTLVRLWGIDAPELSQTCRKFDGHYVLWLILVGEWVDSACGRDARDYLHGLVRGKEVLCLPVSDNRYGRDVRQCYVDRPDEMRRFDLDLAQEMVHAGWALNYRQYSDGRYSKYERFARLSNVGMWHGHGYRFDAPWEWRNHKPPADHRRGPRKEFDRDTSPW